MLKEIQVSKSKRMVFAMDENYTVIHQYPCSTDHYDGVNEYGQRYGNADNGAYYQPMLRVDLDRDNNAMVPAYGWAFINIDTRGRALHGGGSNLDQPYEAYQELLPTYGCFRMHNADIYHLALMMQDSIDKGVDVVLTVVD